MKFSANLTFLFKEYPFLERFAAASESGFDAVEVLFPYDDAVSEIVHKMALADMPMVLINNPPPNYTGGERGFAAVPGSEDRFRRDFKRTLRYAQRLKPLHIHIMAGKAEGLVAQDTFIRNLRWATAEAPNQSLTIEPINPIDMPGYFLADYDQAAKIVTQIDAPNLGLQFDTYQAHQINGDALKTWQDHNNLIRHVQVGSSPDRNEPDRGDVDHTAFFAQLAQDQYDGYVSAKYNPKARTLEGLAWMRDADPERQ